MRVNDGGARPREAKGAAAGKRFGEALQSASRAAHPAEAKRTEGTALAARASGGRRAAADGSDDALRGRREGFREEARAAEPQPAPSPFRQAEAVSTPELRAVVRSLPLAIQTFGLRDGAPLALSFGRSLDVEIRPVPGGIELLLRPEPRLARSAESELRGVVAALRTKGIAVARAEVRVRGGGTRTPRPRVDLPTGVR